MSIRFLAAASFSVSDDVRENSPSRSPKSGPLPAILLGALGALACMFAPVAYAAAAPAIELNDDAGYPVRLAKPAARIISLSPHVTEMLYVAGAGDRLVGVIKYSDFPPEAKKLPIVGDNRAVDYDRILAMNPDLVVVWFHGIAMKQMDKIRSLGIPVFFSDPKSIEQVAVNVERLGLMAGTQAAASTWAAGFRQRHKAMQQKYSGLAPLRVFYQFWNRPLSTLNRDHVVNSLITLCGGTNVFAQTPSIAPAVSVEAVIAANPQVIITGSTNNLRREWVEEWKQWGEIDAVRMGNVFGMDSNLHIRSGPRVLDGAQLICDALETARGKMPPRR